MKTIGIVAEGPRDFELIAAVIDTITNEENSYQMIQPEPDMAGRFGNGWKGVWKWCETNQGSLNTYMNSLTPVLDFLVIHMCRQSRRASRSITTGRRTFRRNTGYLPIPKRPSLSTPFSPHSNGFKRPRPLRRRTRRGLPMKNGKTSGQHGPKHEGGVYHQLLPYQ